MLSRGRILGASLVLALSAAFAAGVVLTRQSAAPVTLATPAATQTASPSPSNQPPPAMPVDVTKPIPITSVSGGGRVESCQTKMGPLFWDPGRDWPNSLTSLYRESATVVVATLTETDGYWARNDGHWPESWTGFDYAPLTATNWHVDRVIKGSAGEWLQTIDAGANRNTIASCQERVPIRQGWPLPATTQQPYVLFLQDGREGYGPNDRWPIIDGVVHPDRDLQAGASDLIAATQPMALDAFIAAMQQ